jgi:CheY-like chemotaxis protein
LLPERGVETFVTTILIADDNSNIQKMVTLAFKDEGIEVVAVGNGEAAVRKAPELMPDLVLADIFMPVRNGYEVCEFIKRNTKLAHVPVILLAGAFDPFDEKEAQRVGADGVLKKPFVPPDPLVALVKELLAKSAAEHLVPVAVTATAPVNLTATESNAPRETNPLRETTAPTAFELPSDAETEETAPFKPFNFREETSESESNGGASAFGSFLNTATEERVDESARATDVESTVHEIEMRPSQPHIDESEIEDAPPKGYSGFSSWLSKTPALDAAASVMEEPPAPPVYSPSADLIASKWGPPRITETRPEEETIVEPMDRFAAEHFPVYDGKPTKQDPEGTDASSFEEEPIADATPRFSESNAAQVEQLVTHAAEHVAEQIISKTKETVAEPPVGAAMNALIEAHEETAQTYPHHLTSEDTQTIDAIRSSAMPWHSAPSAFRGIEQEHPEPATEPAIEPVTDYSPRHWQPGALVEQHNEETASGAEQNIDAMDYDAPIYEAGATEHGSFSSQHTEDVLPAVIPSTSAESFPVPTPLPLDARQIEDIVSRVVERMQPQVLDVITREILRPVVEALVRRQLEQK